MWLSERTRTLLLPLAAALAVALAGCGYTPAYAPNGPAGELRVSIAFDPPKTENEFAFVRQLEQRLGRAEEPRYRLSYQIATVRDSAGVTPAQETIRYNIFGKVSYVLRDAATGAELTSGSTDTFTSYSVASVDVSASPPSTNAAIATEAAERDAYARLMAALADQLVTRLVATSAAWAQ